MQRPSATYTTFIGLLHIVNDYEAAVVVQLLSESWLMHTL